MMIAPEFYIEELKAASYEELIAKRRELINMLYDFEQEYSEGLSDQAMIISPSPEVMYQMHNKYLIEITNLIHKKFNKIVNE